MRGVIGSIRILILAAGLMALAACAGGARPAPASGLPGGASVRAGAENPAPFVSGTLRPYQIRGRWYHPAENPGYDEVGMASWYGDAFNGKPTATGEIFDMHALTAAHKTLPLPALVEVTNLANGRSAILRVNDRGPFVDGRIIDLSRGAAEELGLLRAGVGEVRVRYVGRAPRLGGGQSLQRVEARPAPVQSSPVRAERREVWVQAGAYSDPSAAGRVADRLGEQASVTAANIGGRDLFRVIVGPWPDANRGEQARQAVIARGYPYAMLVSDP